MLKCGDVVHVVEHTGSPCARSVVVHVGMDPESSLPMVLLRDNTAWVGVDGGVPWDSRHRRRYRGRRIYTYNEDRDNELELELIRARLHVVAKRINELPKDSRAELNRVLRKVTGKITRKY